MKVTKMVPEIKELSETTNLPLIEGRMRGRHD